MFICKKCAPKSAKWLFDLAMGISHGPCEICHKISYCINWHGNLDSSDEQKNQVEPLDTCEVSASLKA